MYYTKNQVWGGKLKNQRKGGSFWKDKENWENQCWDDHGHCREARKSDISQQSSCGLLVQGDQK